ncbi:DEAD/DEAH box helicase [Vibrio parahaemolyticus]|nr:DEAD/DEAH box helicase [Vibrio parahaemolyticus]
MFDLKEIMLRCLDDIEERETELLSWGDTLASHSKTEIFSIINQHNGFAFGADEVLEKMEELGYLFCVDNHDDDRTLYRSRMAETVRLQVASRQWFHNQPLSKTKTLVSDFRFLRRRRRYPARNEPALKLTREWRDNAIINERQSEILDLLLTNGPHKFELSGFQKRSTERILQKYEQHLTRQFSPSATIVCSGTGSGKTLSFYLPSITQLATQLLADNSSRVRILAIYPRNELLKDQFSETYSEVRKLDSYLQSNGCRPIRIGTFFGGTFFSRYTDDNTIFNTMSCPEKACSGALSFRKSSNQLRCQSCGKTITESEIGLTRESQRDNPPDILFTTTEMLNQRLSDNSFNGLFGVDTGHTIPIVLMDEVHTYEGSSGAQVSYLLKRWMKRSKIFPHFVGLSATLDDAQQFFADLTSTKKNDVELIEPKESEMEEEGAEYMLALKGDPVSQSALLSTTIQSTMLASRMLNPLSGRKDPLSDNVFGEKTFVFTDDLDVINRLYIQLQDAEGWYGPGRAKSNTPSLVYLRSVLHPKFMQRTLAEQRRNLGLEWAASSKIGHNMGAQTRGIVGRTSSQDTGVNSNSEMVVATASLEVGFNDPKVGAVIQHKSPRGVASYLQRKGRAGRKRGTRPWMYTILSDYGRDRITFQQYEQLVSPKVKSFKLPIQNTHIQKMQASVAIMDYLSTFSPKANVWRVLAEPLTNKGKLTSYTLNSLNNIKRVVQRWVEVDSKDLEVYLKDALKLDGHMLQQVLWASPRSVMMDFLPSLLHKLETNWAVNGNEWAGVMSGVRHPMPEFIAPNLFSELQTPSLYLRLERGPFVSPYYAFEEMGLFPALKEFAPGRVSKRFAINSDQDSDWLVPNGFRPFPGVNASVEFDIEQAFDEKEYQQYVANVTDQNGQHLDIYHPIKVLTQRIPSDRAFDNDPRENFNLAATSNSFLRWSSEFRTPYGRGNNVSIPHNSDWEGIISEMTFYTHDEVNPVELIRYTTGADAELKFQKTQEVSFTQFNWRLDDKPVGIGTRLLVDGAKLVFDFNQSLREQMAVFGDNSFSLRFSYLEDSFINHDVYHNRSFFAKWVFECVICALVMLIEDKDLVLSEAIAELSTVSGLSLLKTIPSEVFNLKEEQEEGAHIDLKEQALQKKLVDYFDSAIGIQEILQALGAVHHSNSSQEYIDWIKEVLGSTIAGGVANLTLQILPDVGEGNVVVDHYWEEDALQVWVTESEVGGVGIINRFKEVYSKDPLNVMAQFSQMFDAGESEQVDFDLHYLLKQKAKKTDIHAAFNRLRNSIGYNERIEAHTSLNRVVSNSGIFTSHTWNTMLYTRVFKPGSSDDNDTFLSKLLTEWRAIEGKVCMEIPLTIISHILAKRHHDNKKQLSSYRNFVLSLLWPRGNQIRQGRLENYNRFTNKRTRTERLLITKIITNDEVKVDYQIGWEQKLEQLLTTEGRCVLVIPTGERNKIGQVSATINTLVIDINGLLIYPRISMLKQSIGKIEISVELAEIMQ